MQRLLSKFAELYNHQHSPVLEYFHCPNKIPQARLQLIPIPNPQPQATTNLFAGPIVLPFLDISYKWNKALGGLLCFIRIQMLDAAFHLHMRKLRSGEGK